MSGRRTPSAPLIAGLVSLVVAVALSASGPAWAAWSTSGAGSGAGAAQVMATGLVPHGTAAGNIITISWTAVDLTGGTPVQGYSVTRRSVSSGISSAAGGSCAGVVTTTTCSDSAQAVGGWTYTDTPVQMNWTGSASPPSATITIGAG